jgi:hypothetical protein
MTEPQQSTPLSWRDVHTLVKDSRDEILATMKEGFSGTTKVLEGHGIRIAALEAQNVIEASAKEARRLVQSELEAAGSARNAKIDRFFSGWRGLALIACAAIGTAKTIGVF